MSGTLHKHLLAGLLWCPLLGALYFVMAHQLEPKVATVSATAREIVIPRSRDGHFYVAGRIGSERIDFMVDTGAGTTAINAAAARRIGLPSGRPVAVHTAGGSAAASEISGQRLQLGGITLNDVRLLILPDMQIEALLGQNVLRHLEVVQTAQAMTLRARTP